MIFVDFVFGSLCMCRSWKLCAMEARWRYDCASICVIYWGGGRDCEQAAKLPPLRRVHHQVERHGLWREVAATVGLPYHSDADVERLLTQASTLRGAAGPTWEERERERQKPKKEPTALVAPVTAPPAAALPTPVPIPVAVAESTSIESGGEQAAARVEAPAGVVTTEATGGAEPASRSAVAATPAAETTTAPAAMTVVPTETTDGGGQTSKTTAKGKEKGNNKTATAAEAEAEEAEEAGGNNAKEKKRKKKQNKKDSKGAEIAEPVQCDSSDLQQREARRCSIGLTSFVCRAVQCRRKRRTCSRWRRSWARGSEGYRAAPNSCCYCCYCVCVWRSPWCSRLCVACAWRAHATTQGKVEYLIKWEGYPEASNTWEKQEDVFCTGEPAPITPLPEIGRQSGLTHALPRAHSSVRGRSTGEVREAQAEVDGRRQAHRGRGNREAADDDVGFFGVHRR